MRLPNPTNSSAKVNVPITSPLFTPLVFAIMLVFTFVLAVLVICCVINLAMQVVVVPYYLFCILTGTRRPNLWNWDF